MNIYKTKWLKIIIDLLFPIVIFGVLFFEFSDMGFWILIAVLLIFCGVWKDIKNLLFSNILTWLISIPLWWFLVARYKAWGSEMLAWSPVTFVNYLIFVLAPIILIVLLRNNIIRYFVNKKQAKA